jgi:two-component system OmpR family response regulator
MRFYGGAMQASVPDAPGGGAPRPLLLVEDDPAMAASLLRALSAEGYEVTWVGTGPDALIAFGERRFAVAVVDVMLPAMTGFEVTRRIRSGGGTLPILLLTARDAVDDRVKGLDAGADDYLTKPFSFDELAARLRALLRRDAADAWIRTEFGDVVLDAESRRATIAGRAVAFSPNEFQLLRELLVHPERAASVPMLLEAVWGSAAYLDPNIVHQYVSAVRRKLAGAGSTVSIVTQRGSGYRAVIA